MPKTLLIVESPAKAKTIEKYLKNLGDYKVLASIGHIRDLPKSNKNAVDIEAGFVPNYVDSPGKKKVVDDIVKAAKGVDEVLLATDPDREGEAIAWHLAQILKEKGVDKNIKRVTYQEITKEAIKEAIENPRDIDEHLKQAQEARRVLDRLVGYDLSGLIWKKVRYGLSAGRVQSPALRILMEKEREIRAFNPETYWVITADMKKGKDKITFICTEEPRDHKEVEKILETGKKDDWNVVEVKETEAKRSPNAPFITSTLQQTASTRLGFAPSRTMGIAQKLYEAGHITYMRTDSTSLSANAFGQIAGTIEKEFGKDYLQPRKFKSKSKNAQEAHEAIRPSSISKKSAGSTRDQKALYDLIWKRTVASQMKDAKILRTKILANVSGGDIPNFSVNGSRLLDEGWLKVDPGAKGEDTLLPEIKEGDQLKLVDIQDEEKQTTPPPRYSEAGLIKELEKRDIGRPSTYASIIKTIVDRGYVEKEGKTLIPTDTGDVVSSFLEDHFMDYISDSFTAEMENELDEIAEGKREYAKTLKDFYGPFQKDVEAKEDIPKLTTLGDADPKYKCPTCKSGMHIKLGKNGKFLSCSKYPDCEGALTIDGKKIGDEEPLGKHPDYDEDIYVFQGRFGPYVQVGKNDKEKAKDKTAPKPRRASIPKNMDAEDITLEQAIHLLKLPRVLGVHPDDGEEIIANIGQYGPYVGHNGSFRSIKKDDPYTITLKRALEVLAEPKQPPRGAEIVKELGKHPKTKRDVTLFKSKSGLFLKKGLKRIYLPESTDPEKLTLEEAVEIVKAS